MIRLRKLTMKGFRSFVDETVVEFPENGLLLLQGRNGSGKSSLGLAIAYALGYCPFPATALQSWQGRKNMQVTLELDSNKGSVTIRRGVVNSVTVGDLDTEGSITAVEAKIREIVGLDSAILGELCYRPQQTRGTFLSKTDREKKEFLCGLLGLDSFEAAADNAKNLLSLSGDMAESYGEDAERSEQKVAAFGPAPVCTDYSQEILVTEQEIKNLVAERNALILQSNKLAEDESQLRMQYHADKQAIDEKVWAYGNTLVIEPYDRKNLDEYDRLFKKLQKKLDALVAADQKRMADHFKAQEDEYKDRNRILATIASIDVELNITRPKIVKDLETLLDNKCPTCEQDWAQAQDLIAQAQMQIDTIDKRARELPELSERLTEIESKERKPFESDPEIVKFRELQNEVTRKFYVEQAAARSHDQAQQHKYEVAVENYRNELEKSVAELYNNLTNHTKEIVQLDDESVHVLRIQTEAEKKLDRLRLIQALEQRALMDWQKSLDAAKQVAQEERRKADYYEEQVRIERDFIDLIGRDGFLGAIFDEVLREISDETNKVLAALPNTSDVFLEFASEKETGSGKIAREIKPVVTIRGFTAPVRAGASGGMFLSIEQAVDIAINRVVTRRTGVMPGWLVLDECFGDQDLVTKEEAMIVLRELGKDRLVIVVDHATEFKEAFTQFINLKMEDGRSYVTV
jgi:DNA repair exonuclease SbcCD ATPase subunit